MTGLFKEKGRKLVENGYAIVPIPPGTKGPSTPGWQQNYASSIEAFEELAADNPRCGVGIITKHTPAIDIDCLDERITAHMRLYCLTNIGPAPERIGKAPKTLLLYAADKPFRKVMSAAYSDPESPQRNAKGKLKGQRLEILGDGQQFVAYHIHPETGKPYDWPSDWENPLDVSALDLTVITQQDAEDACREFERLCEEAGWEKLSDASSPSQADDAETDAADALAELDPPDETDEEVARVKSALAVLSSDCSYEEWRNVLFALKWTRWDCAESLARDWSEESDDFDPQAFKTVWRGAQKRDRGREVTLGTLFNMAKKVGWDASRVVTPEKKAATYESLLAMVAELAEEEDKREGIQKIIEKLAEVGLSSSDEGQVLKAIKKETGDTVADLRRDLFKARKAHVKEVSHLATHGGYASKLIEELTESSGVEPVGVEGMIYTYSQKKGVWVGVLTPDFSVKVSELFDGQENCSRRNDYMSIAQHAYSILAEGKEDFFSSSPIGLACKGRFYKVTKDGEIEREEIDHNHRQRVLSPAKPVVGEMPMFNRFLDDVFKGDPDNEQRDLLQEVMGAILLGMLARFEKVVLLKGPGRSGKGTIMKIIESMLPKEVRSAVTPFRWDSEYYLANLAGKRLNLVGELPDDEPIPASYFKSVIGRDTLTGRHPSHRPFQFQNEAAHIFNANHFVYTKERSDAFYTRWILMEFRNSLIGREDLQVTDLAQRIIDNELSAIMAWALKGAKRLQDRGHFLLTATHKKLMSQWQRRTDSFLEFLLDGEVCSIGSTTTHITRRSELYKEYVEWCRNTNRRPIGKIKLYDALDESAIMALGLRKGCDKTGHDIVRGVRLLSDAWVDPPEMDEDEL